MELGMDEVMELWLPSCTFVSNSGPENDLECLNYFSPFAGGENAFFDQTLMESMLMDTEYSGGGEVSTTISPCTTTSAGSPAYETPPAAAAVFSDDGREIRVLHLLMAAAESLSGVSKSRDLARVILARLRELETAAVDGGGAFYRLAAHFTEALKGILDGGGGYRGSEHHRQGDVLEAFQLLQDMSPYVKFGHFTANQGILEAVAGERRVHIVDYDVMEGVQWAALMQAFVSKPGSGAPPRLRITAVTVTAAAGNGSGRRSAATVQETGRRLTAFAASIGLQFSFGVCRMNDGEEFRPAAVKLVKGEAVVFNCVLHPPHLPHRNGVSVLSFLGGAATLGARVVTVVEEDRGGAAAGEFIGEFMDEMERYSAILDSLEAGFPMQGRAREVVERVILGPGIAGAVERAYRRREEDSSVAGLGRWEWRLEEGGFERAELSFFNLCQARLLVGLFNDGYRIEEDGMNKLVLCWKSRRLFSASVWSAPANLPPAVMEIGS